MSNNKALTQEKDRSHLFDKDEASIDLIKSILNIFFKFSICFLFVIGVLEILNLYYVSKGCLNSNIAKEFIGSLIETFQVYTNFLLPVFTAISGYVFGKRKK